MEGTEAPHCAVKGKRTKRQRHHLQHAPTPSSPASLSLSSSSTDLSLSLSSTTTDEEEDMANCLILLAQGPNHPPSRKSTATNKSGSYECKTCNRSFSSFQALGGHRASHKKPRATDEGHVSCYFDCAGAPSLSTSTKIEEGKGENNGNSKGRVHECSVCGSEFASGQALGGHMRRHRLAPLSEPTVKKGALGLDLNLPAPEDETDNYAKFQGVFGGGFVQSQPLVSFAALVDCHN
ncbi:hypothetical protein AMTRI_Chr07g26710 [Amborella trichopoda]|uniref:C2H2-type domain-containing protein n=1 Tax=Amborella trichopoda TaxID=13333 RepID=W1NY00_AMBTC|nr:zinc finger protein ZAT5 [Amborella trichopoda]ERN00533.1 hypothetical protein AMTR_s00102p00073930 [Amborella trichopoda]|eukprot:XP_006837964.1 zinc finger protein ZAT5 [Amborella trichopoda]